MKRILAVLLTVIMLFTLAMPSFAAAEEEYDGYPIIVVRGISPMGLVNEDGSKAIDINPGEVLGVLLQCVISRFALKNEDALFDSLSELVNSVVSPIACDKEGNISGDVTMRQYDKSMANYPGFGYYDEAEGGILKAAVKEFGAENVYYFTYDYRKTAEQLGNELSELIETAKADSGKDKVNIICASMGCVVTTAYFYYCDGYESVNSAVYLSGAHNGLYSCSDALNGKVTFDTDVVKAMVSDLLDGNFLVRILLEIFDRLGAFDYLTGYLNRMVSDNFDKVNDAALRDTLGTMPGLWTFCADDDFDSAVDKIFAGHEEEYSVVLGKIEEIGRFNKSTDEVLAKAYEAGVKITFLSHYNRLVAPVYDRSDYHSDSVIETELTSNFATVAKYGETLSDEYLEGVEDKSYISPDKVIDASTAWYRDYTWFIKDADHVGGNYGSEMDDFIFLLATSEEQPTIYSFAEYPQFLIADENQDLDILR